MIRRPPRSTLDRSSAASDVYKRQGFSPKATLESAVNLEKIANDHVLSGGAIMNVIRYASLQALKEGGRALSAEDLLNGIRKEHAKAVSYTHLRAHETVLDLVCRLLLEKKKQKNNTKNKKKKKKTSRHCTNITHM